MLIMEMCFALIFLLFMTLNETCHLKQMFLVALFVIQFFLQHVFKFYSCSVKSLNNKGERKMLCVGPTGGQNTFGFLSFPLITNGD